jgi:hypothetical protein
MGLASVKDFKTPSGKVVCAWVDEGLSFQDDVACEVTKAFPRPDPEGGHGFFLSPSRWRSF